MSPKEKAEELLNKYYLELKQDNVYYDLETARMCALICVNEIIKHNPNLPNEYSCTKSYWEEVKQEIEKI